MSLGERIKEQRKACDMSQEKVAELVGVSRQAVTKWEAERSAPSTENLFEAVFLSCLSSWGSFWKSYPNDPLR